MSVRNKDSTVCLWKEKAITTISNNKYLFNGCLSLSQSLLLQAEVFYMQVLKINWFANDEQNGSATNKM